MNPNFTLQGQGLQDEIDVSSLPKHCFAKIMKLYSRKLLLVLTIFFAIVLGVLPLLMNVFMGELMNAMNQDGDIMIPLRKVIYKMLVFILAITIVNILAYTFHASATAALMVDLRKKLFTCFMRQDIKYFDKTPTGVLIGRLSQDVTLIHEMYIDKMLLACTQLAQAVGGVVLAFIIYWPIALAACGIILISTIVYYIGDKIIEKFWVVFNETSTSATNKAEEVITSFRTIKSFDNELFESQEYTKQLYEINKVFVKTSVAQGLKDAIIAILINAMIGGFAYWASYLIIEHPSVGLQSGDLVILLLSLIFSTMGISTSLSFSDDFKKAQISSGKLLSIFDLEPEVDQKEGKQLDEIKGKVEFRDVTFKYESNEGYAVKNLSFIVNPGETVAFVGESGCGKSTTLQLLQRFYEIESGSILVDDVDIRTLQPSYLRSQISTVPQGPVLFSMSVKDNIRYARMRATDEEIADAARVGNAHNFIMEIPNNYSARVQQTSLSGGQKQRICISRAILANTPILLLDEATAALDTESEQLVQQSLEEVRKGKTAILVAHRLATVIHADRIFVFKDGKIAESGTHQQLLAQEGMYADLVKYQLQ